MATGRPAAQNKYTVQYILNYSYDETFDILTFMPQSYDPTTNTTSRAFPANPLNLKPFDYATRSVTDDTETWTFKSGGSSGTTTNTVVIVYTDSTLEEIESITKT